MRREPGGRWWPAGFSIQARRDGSRAVPAGDFETDMETTGPAVCLVSGGMDSCVTAAIAARENREIAFLHARYGQRTEIRELRAFHQVADHFQVRRRLVVDLRHLAAIGGSALTDRAMAVPKGDLNRQGIP